MGKISEAQAILRAIGMPERQQTPICALSLLALAHIRPDDDWCQASNEWIRIHDIIQFVNLDYEVDYAENSRETFRKQAMHHFRNAALIEDNGKATNSPNYRYRLTQETVRLLQTFHTDLWEKSLKEFTDVHESLIFRTHRKNVQKMPVMINDGLYFFSPGKHNTPTKSYLGRILHRALHQGYLLVCW